MSEIKIGEIELHTLEGVVKEAYLDYAVSAIVRALPDARDGLKPVQRRILYAMHVLGNDHTKQTKKSTRIVGDVIGKYHPHGESAIYEALVRMAQPFSLRYNLVIGQGNFGSIDGDSAASSRYTEVKLAKLSQSLLQDISKNTVDFVPNYDSSEYMPSVMPTKIPNLLVNGSTGIAVGMATNVPPHNLYDVIQAVVKLIDDPETDITELIEIVKGPDFPTGGIINGRNGIVEAYKTGRGKIYIKAKANIETSKNQDVIVISEIPYMLNKSRLLEKIGSLVRDKRIEGISAFRDESDREGMRIVVEVRRGENAEVILNQLYQLTPLESVFGINMVILDQGQPKCMGLKEILSIFIDHRRDVVRRRTQYDINKGKGKAHLLEGLAVALINIDDVVSIIRKSKNSQDAKEALITREWSVGEMKLWEDEKIKHLLQLEPQAGYRNDSQKYRLSERQVVAILDMRLHRLTSLESDKILMEYQDLIKIILGLMEILNDYQKLMGVIREELIEVADQYRDERKTEIIDRVDLDDLDLIPDEPVVVTISSQGYTKVQALDGYKAQKRGGVGKASAVIKDEDYVSHLSIATRHDSLLCFSDRGRLYWLRVYRLPLVNRNSKGKPLVNYLPLEEGEQITTILPINSFEGNKQVVMATRSGVIKRVALRDFSRPRSSGIIAINLDENDALIGAAVTETEDVMLFSKTGKVIRFSNEDVRVMGRGARGVRGIRLKEADAVVSMVVADSEREVMTVASSGFGKKTKVEDFRRTGRGGQGVIAMQLTDSAEVVSASSVSDDDDIFLITSGGTLVRIAAAEVPTIGRSTKGVKMLRLKKKETLVTAQVFVQGIETEQEPL
jgi:DNA gyrase subunit A